MINKNTILNKMFNQTLINIKPTTPIFKITIKELNFTEKIWMHRQDISLIFGLIASIMVIIVAIMKLYHMLKKKNPQFKRINLYDNTQNDEESYF
jgi:hypothetical protein